MYQKDGRAGRWYFQGGGQLLKPGAAAHNLGHHTATLAPGADLLRADLPDGRALRRRVVVE